MARTDSLGNFLTDVADAIRTKKGTSETILASDFDTEIENLPSGGGADLDEYFVTEITENTTMQAAKKAKEMIKKYADVIVDNSVTSLQYAFYYFGDKRIPKVICNNNVTDMQYMYYNNNTVTSIDLTGLNTSNVTNMQNMFQSCSAITSLDFSNFDTSKVSYAQNMFSSCLKLVSLDLSGQTFLNIMSTQGMFQNCKALTSIDLSSFVGSRVNSSGSTFADCTSLKHLDIRNWLLTNIYTLSAPDMFKNIPTDCEIIVKSQTEKDWVLDRRSDLTNVKTVAEYEAEQNA